MGEMALIGRMHPLLVHFPIALVMVAVAAELAGPIAGQAQWRTVAAVNLRVAAAFAVVTSIAGWRLAAASVDVTPLLQWHRWLGVAAAATTVAAALATTGANARSLIVSRIYRGALICAAAFVAAAAHLGGLLVWGADFLRP